MGRPASPQLDMFPGALPVATGAATISPCGRYRYALSRVWGDRTSRVVFCMLNPSTADATEDDPTIRRCIGFAKMWGYGALDVVNLFGLIATDPKELQAPPDPVGQDNDLAIVRVAAGARSVVGAWGVHGALFGRDRHVAAMLGAAGIAIVCLGVTKQGQPKHPLYLPKYALRLPWAPKRLT